MYNRYTLKIQNVAPLQSRGRIAYNRHVAIIYRKRHIYTPISIYCVDETESRTRRGVSSSRARDMENAPGKTIDYSYNTVRELPATGPTAATYFALRARA